MIASPDQKAIDSSNAVISRMMGPDDTQMYGMVHGGVLLQLAEEAGSILSTQYCNAVGDDAQSVETVSACVERADFLQPMMKGEVADVHAEIVYTSTHSLRIFVDIYAKNILKGEKRLCCTAKIWYVPLTNGKQKVLVSVRKMTAASPKAEEDGEKTYLDLKHLRNNVIRPRLENIILTKEMADEPKESERQTVSFSQITMRRAIHPSACWAGQKYLRGGEAMKWMDEAGSLSAATHASHHCFTACVDTIMFLKKINIGTVLVVTSKPIFVSSRSMEALVTVDEQRLDIGRGMFRERAIEAIFTFISLDQKGKAIEMPPLKLKTDEEIRLFDKRKKIYEKRIQEKKKST